MHAPIKNRIHGPHNGLQMSPFCASASHVPPCTLRCGSRKPSFSTRSESREHDFSERRSESGIILVDLAITVLVIGLLIAGSIQFYQYFGERNRTLETDVRMEAVTKALSTYVQKRWRLPCPANPSRETGEAFGIERTGGCAANVDDAHGIVPYRTLGIPERYAKDGYGNFMTYIVSPAFTDFNRVRGDGNDVVHDRLVHYFAAENVSLLPKAQFCGSLRAVGGNNTDNTTDLDVDGSGSDIFPELRDADAGDFEIQPYIFAGPPDANYNREARATALAVALISHGSNGYGAYTGDPPGVDPPTQNDDMAFFPAGTFGDSEDVNKTIDRAVELQRVRSDVGDNTNYDDVIIVMTQDQVLAAAGGGSCEHP